MWAVEYLIEHVTREETPPIRHAIGYACVERYSV